MKTALRLIPIDLDAIAAIELDVSRFGAERGLDLGEHATTISSVAAASAVIAAVADRHAAESDGPWWAGYLAVEQETSLVVGTAAFKAPPHDGSVEIAYYTFPGFEGRGIGSAMAALLVSTAAESPAVTQVIAHTLPERNASGAILTRNGFTMTGDVIDPEDGLVWRWERATFS